MKAIFFDLDGTLLHFTKDYDDILKDTFIETCGRCEDDWIESYSTRFFEYFNNFESSPYRKAFQQTEAECDPIVFVECLQKNELNICESPSDCESTLDSLSQDHKIGVLTNGVSEWQRNKLEEFDLKHYFDSIIASYDIGFHKPESEVFEFAEDSVSATEFEMIGDSQEDDIEGAINAGWDARRYCQQGFGSLF